MSSGSERTAVTEAGRSVAPGQRERRRETSLLTQQTVLERAKGIEPSYAAWEAAVLPLNYARDRPHD
jgi:hypothetical protein